MGGRGSKGSKLSYARIPFAVTMGYGTKEEKKQARDTVRSFIKGARVGDQYATGYGIGSGSEKFSIVSYSRSPNKMGIQAEGMRPVALSTANAKKWLVSGARLVKRSRKRTEKWTPTSLF